MEMPSIACPPSLWSINAVRRFPRFADPQDSALPTHQVEVVLELHQKDAFALVYAAGIRAVLIVAQNADVLQHYKIPSGPWRRENDVGKHLPRVAVGIVNHGGSWNDGAPPPVGADIEK